MPAAIYGHMTFTCFHYEKNGNCNQRSGAQGHGRTFFSTYYNKKKDQTDEAIQAENKTNLYEKRKIIMQMFSVKVRT